MSSIKNILITDLLSMNALQTLKLNKKIKVLEAGDWSQAHALLIRSKTKIDKALLERAPLLEVIVTATSGFDHIDFSALEKTQIKVMHTPNANAISAAELTWSLMLACTRKILQAHRAVKSGEWKSEALNGWELHGKSYGIVGLGRIGSRVAKIANAFGMRVVAFDPYKDKDHFESLGVARLSYEEILKKSDVLSFHVPKTRETNRMFGASQIEYVTPEIIVVNTSRGSVLAEADVCKALEEKKIRALGLDVFENEPLSRNSNLLKLDTVVLSPHLGAATYEAYERASLEAAKKLIAFFETGSTSDTLPPQENWAQRSTQHQVWD